MVLLCFVLITYGFSFDAFISVAGKFLTYILESNLKLMSSSRAKIYLPCAEAVYQFQEEFL